VARPCVHRSGHLRSRAPRSPWGRKRVRPSELAGPRCPPATRGRPSAASPRGSRGTSGGGTEQPTPSPAHAAEGHAARCLRPCTSASEPRRAGGKPSRQRGSHAAAAIRSRGTQPGSGEGAPRLVRRLSKVLLGSSEAGKPNSLHILVVCCEIVS